MRVLVLTVALVWPALGYAQLDEARARLDTADFTGAVREFDRAELSQILDRETLLEIYEGRAIARWALGQVDLALVDLRALDSIDPEHVLAPEAPPTLRNAFAALPHSPIRLSISVDRGEREGVLRAEVAADPGGLVRSLRWHARTEGGAWSDEPTSTITFFDTPPSVRIEARVEAIGPGGAVVASEDVVSEPPPEPLPIVEIPAEPVEASPVAPPIVDAHERAAPNDDALWAGVAIGSGVALVAIVIVVVLVLTAPGGATQLARPVLVGF